jgi:hypothetical protein
MGIETGNAANFTHEFFLYVMNDFRKNLQESERFIKEFT